LRLSNQKFIIISHLTHSCYMYCPSPYPWADHRNVLMRSTNYGAPHYAVLSVLLSVNLL
jgi:hypothetical protein